MLVPKSKPDLADEVIVVSMCSNPEPLDAPIGNIVAQSTIVLSNPYGPNFSDRFEVEGRVMGILLQKLVLFPG